MKMNKNSFKIYPLKLHGRDEYTWHLSTWHFNVEIEVWHVKLSILFAFQEPEIEIMTFSFPDLFDNYMQQDAHEFLNYLLNTIADILQEEKKQEKQNGKLKNGNMNEPAENNKPELTWVHEIFQGTLTNETRCLNCETVSIAGAFHVICSCVFVQAVLCVSALWYTAPGGCLWYTQTVLFVYMSKLLEACLHPRCRSWLK